MFNEKLFRMKLLEKDKSLSDIAEILDINLVTLYRKMKGPSDFFRDEIQNICVYLNLNAKEMEAIFFNQKITET